MRSDNMPRPFAPEHSEQEGVQRFELYHDSIYASAGMIESADGDYVLYTDYAQREAEHAAVVEGLREQHARDSAEMLRLCAARNNARLDRAAAIRRAEAAERERDKLRRHVELLQRAVDRWVPCPDHRDKTEPGCYVCRLERSERERDALRADAWRYRWLRENALPQYAISITANDGVPSLARQQEITICGATWDDLTVAALSAAAPPEAK